MSKLKKRPRIKSVLKRYSHKGCDTSKGLLRSKSHNYSKGREFIEEIWDKYAYYFETHMKASFYDFYAEMVTGYYLAEKQGFELHNKDTMGMYPNAQDNKHGPDFKIANEPVWVECISVEDIADEGRIERTLELDSLLNDEQRRIGKMKNLTLMNPVRAKSKKFRKYIEEGIVSKEDYCVISLSLHKVAHKMSREQIENCLKDIFEVFEMEEIYGVLCFYGDFEQSRSLFVKNPNNIHKNAIFKP
jgi:hypothetical protein